MIHTEASFQTSSRQGTESSRLAVVLPALATMGLGVFFLWAVGFSPMAEMHNAAHDTRHSNAFPCH